MASMRSRRGKRRRRMAKICPKPQSVSSLSCEALFRCSVISMSAMKTTLTARRMARPMKAGRVREEESDAPRWARRILAHVLLRYHEPRGISTSCFNFCCRIKDRLRAWIANRKLLWAAKVHPVYTPRKRHIGATRLAPGTRNIAYRKREHLRSTCDWKGMS
ncbi:hypothetical protein BKA70DRAFT_266003 [Coprinopsis sp. MPI-PUGE-AT-0042]|nr:hypothetical protein BKA70DRAFT_266003 [Coprinopsis sp. MPI-PUGE-AT-0042]